MNYYKVLGVPRDADPDTIKRAYRRLALENHPDRHPDDPEAVTRFRKATEAFKVLGDEKKRTVYDRKLRPINSVSDLFARPVGQRLVSVMLPSGPAAPRDGIDTVIIVEVSTEIIEYGGTIEIPNPCEPGNRLAIPVEAGYQWCCLHGLGEPGRNGGKIADLYIHLVPVQKSKQQEGRG